MKIWKNNRLRIISVSDRRFPSGTVPGKIGAVILLRLGGGGGGVGKEDWRACVPRWEQVRDTCTVLLVRNLVTWSITINRDKQTVSEVIACGGRVSSLGGSSFFFEQRGSVWRWLSISFRSNHIPRGHCGGGIDDEIVSSLSQDP